jgi:hypothetical protein
MRTSKVAPKAATVYELVFKGTKGPGRRAQR